jgi:hypothetical protein
VTLHFYNALLRVKAIQPGQVELLDWIFDAFKKWEAMWNGPIPERGQFQYRWLIASGMNEELVAQMQGNTSQKRPGKGDRKATPVKLEVVIKCFRRVCCRMDVFAGYIKDTVDSMKENERLLGTNVVVLEYILNQFYLELFHVCGQSSLVEKYNREGQKERKRARIQNQKAEPTLIHGRKVKIS